MINNTGIIVNTQELKQFEKTIPATNSYHSTSKWKVNVKDRDSLKRKKTNSNIFYNNDINSNTVDDSDNDSNCNGEDSDNSNDDCDNSNNEE